MPAGRGGAGWSTAAREPCQRPAAKEEGDNDACLTMPLALCSSSAMIAGSRGAPSRQAADAARGGGPTCMASMASPMLRRSAAVQLVLVMRMMPQMKTPRSQQEATISAAAARGARSRVAEVTQAGCRMVEVDGSGKAPHRTPSHPAPAGRPPQRLRTEGAPRAAGPAGGTACLAGCGLPCSAGSAPAASSMRMRKGRHSRRYTRCSSATSTSASTCR